MKGMMHFSKKRKLIRRYKKHIKILNKVGVVAYRLALPPSLSGVHPVFHLPILKKYHRE